MSVSAGVLVAQFTSCDARTYQLCRVRDARQEIRSGWQDFEASFDCAAGVIARDKHSSMATEQKLHDVMIDGVSIPDSRLVRAITELVRDTESELLFNHSSRVFFFGALAGRARGLTVNLELLYAAAMFHDIGLVSKYSSSDQRFEVDGANAAAAFLRSWHVDPLDVERVWTGIALHTTPGIPELMHPVVALTTAGVDMDVLGITYDNYAEVVRDAVVSAFPRSRNFKEDIIQAFYDGIAHKPQTTFGNVKADVIADKLPGFEGENFCAVIRGSKWAY
jgi:hypothetical protein